MQDVPSARTDAERNRRVLLAAAAGALARDPDASLGEIARLAGLTRATLYRHFASREKLVDELRGDALKSAAEAVAAARIDEGNPVEALRRVTAAIAALGGRFWPLLMEGADRDPEFQRGRTEAFAPVVDVIERGQASGQIRRDIPAQWALTALMALLAAAVREGKDSQDAGVAKRVVDTIVFGIHQPPTT